MKIFKIAKSDKCEDLEKDIKDIKKDIFKLQKDLDDLNIGHRKFNQMVTPFNSLQRKIERFEKIEEDFKDLKKGLDKRIKERIREERNKKLRPLYEWRELGVI